MDAARDERRESERSSKWRELLPRIEAPRLPWPPRFIAALAIVSAGSAAFAIGFRALLGLVFRHAYGAPDVVTAFAQLPWYLRIVIPALGGVAVALVTKAGSRFGGGQGVGDVMEAVVLGRVRLSMRATLFKSAASWLAIVSGGSLGREGPIIQFGGSLGKVAGRSLRNDEFYTRVLIAAGTAAGFAAAYNTPIAAVLFVLEVVMGVIALDVAVPVAIAATIATLITRMALGEGPLYGQRAFGIASNYELFAYALLGVLSAGAGALFMALLRRGEALFARVPKLARPALGGLGVGLVALFLPQVTGNGYEPLAAVLDGRIVLSGLVMLLVFKPIATTSSVASGNPGGVFTPTMMIGASIGMVLAHLFPLIGATGSPGGYALVGMAAMLAATTHAPIMASVLAFEMSGDYAIVLPLLVATSIATLIARRIDEDSVYTAEARRKGFAWTVTLDGRRVETDVTPD